jgi:hypothetical protein
LTRHTLNLAWPAALGACLALVALAARGGSWSSASLEGGAAPKWVLFGILAAAALAALGLLVRGLWRSGRMPLLFATLLLATFLGGVTVFVALHHAHNAPKPAAVEGTCLRARPSEREPCPTTHERGRGGGGIGIPGLGGGTARGSGDPPSDRLWAIAAVLALFALTWGIAAWQRRAPATRREPGLEPEGLAAAIDDALDDLRSEPDPRRAVIACYARMEGAFDRAGFARVPSEAPLEFLTRALGELRVRPAAIELLTRAFEEAKFSHHPIGERMRDDAIEALAQVRKDLGSAAAGALPTRHDPVEAV